MNMKRWFLAMAVFAVFFMNSCLIPKKVVYVEDMEIDKNYQVLTQPVLKIQKNDRLSIVVSVKDLELAAPFNQLAGGYQVSEKGEIQTRNINTVNHSGYLVDQQGEIDFPILGTVAVEGKTLEELKGYLIGQLEGKGLLQNPIIKIELLNLKINMMGAVQSIGVLNVPDAKITLLEAISKSGGLKANASPTEITVIREENGQRKMIQTDITQYDIFNSPAYHLQQNDIVYVKPKFGEMTVSQQNNRFYLSTTVSLVSLVFTFLNWMK